MEISKYFYKTPILNFTRLIGENTFDGIVDGHIEAKNIDVYEGGEILSYGLVIFPTTPTTNGQFGNKGHEQINIGDTIISIYCESITSDSSKPMSLELAQIPIKIINK